jgi:hypothetical protein
MKSGSKNRISFLLKTFSYSGSIAQTSAGLHKMRNPFTNNNGFSNPLNLTAFMLISDIS